MKTKFFTFHNQQFLYIVLSISSLFIGYGIGQVMSRKGIHFLQLAQSEDATIVTSGEALNSEEQSLLGQFKTSSVGSITISFDKQSATIGEDVVATVSLDSGATAISGFDILIKYNQADWKVVSDSVETKSETAFTNFPLNTVNREVGMIELSGLTDLSNSSSGKVDVGSFLLRPQNSGTLMLELVFDGQGMTTDSNLASVESGEDVLLTVENAELVIN